MPRDLVVLNAGGVDDTNFLTANRYKTGLVGCVGELSIGSMVNINMLHKAEKGKNIDKSCYQKKIHAEKGEMF